MRLLLFAFTLATALLGLPSPIEACVCGVAVSSTVESRREAVRAALSAADAVFLGEVTNSDGLIGDSITTSLTVSKVWKGTLNKTVHLYQATRRDGDLIEMSTCTLMVDKGTWVVFASNRNLGLLVAGVCGLSGRLDEKAEVIKFLDEIGRTLLGASRSKTEGISDSVGRYAG